MVEAPLPDVERKKELATRPVRPLTRPGNALSMALARGLVAALGKLGRGGRLAVARFVAGLAWSLRIRRAVTVDNLRQALPELPEPERRRIARGAYLSMGLAALEALNADKIIASEEELLTWENAELFHQLAQEGKPAILVTAHFGNWELVGDAMARRGVKMCAVVRPLEGSINAVIVEHRRNSGVELIAARGAVRGTLSALERGKMVAILLDQSVPAHQGVFVPFFGRLASTSPLAALVAQRTGAPVFVAVGIREGARMKVSFEGPLPVPDSGDRDADLRTFTAQLTAALERRIRAHPEQWNWLHRRWKVQPP